MPSSLPSWLNQASVLTAAEPAQFNKTMAPASLCAIVLMASVTGQEWLADSVSNKSKIVAGSCTRTSVSWFGFGLPLTKAR